MSGVFAIEATDLKFGKDSRFGTTHKERVNFNSIDPLAVTVAPTTVAGIEEALE